MKIAFIDFETANRKRTSICSVGISTQVDGEEVDSFYSLIRPTPFRIDPFNKQINGLDYSDLNSAPDFIEIYPEIKKRLCDCHYVVSHNAKFDMDCLSTILFDQHMPFPTFQYACSCEISKTKFDKNTLKELLEYYNLPIEDHHNALSDARMCASVYWRLREDITPEYCGKFLKDFRDRYDIEVEQAQRCSWDLSDDNSDMGDKEDVPLTSNNLPFKTPDKIEFPANFLVTGSFIIEKREKIEEIIKINGGKIQNSANGRTNYVIVGSVASPGWARGNYGRKIEGALKIPGITFINEKDFVKLYEEAKFKIIKNNMELF